LQEVSAEHIFVDGVLLFVGDRGGSKKEKPVKEANKLIEGVGIELVFVQGREGALRVHIGGVGRDGRDNTKADNNAFDSEGVRDRDRGVIELAVG
jgi:hypothetical protein